MSYYVYLIVSKVKKKTISYVGYTNNINNRINLHNSGKGAKFTKGKKWKLIYSKKYETKRTAMIQEYKLKNKKKLSYVGYSKDLKKRLNLHNSGKGAKFTRGKKWNLVYYKKYDSKSTAMKEEFRLKKNYKLRKKIVLKKI